MKSEVFLMSDVLRPTVLGLLQQSSWDLATVTLNDSSMKFVRLYDVSFQKFCDTIGDGWVPFAVNLSAAETLYNVRKKAEKPCSDYEIFTKIKWG